MILAVTSSPTLTYSLISLTTPWEISDKWINPCIPPSRSINAPNLEILEIGAVIESPSLNFLARISQGFSLSLLIDNEIFSLSSPITFTLTFIPTLANLDGSVTCPQSISETWTNHSKPSKVTNKPYDNIPDTTHSTISPSFNVFNALDLSSSIAAFSEKIIFLPPSSTFITLTLKSKPTKLFKCSRIFSGSAHSTLG